MSGFVLASRLTIANSSNVSVEYGTGVMKFRCHHFFLECKDNSYMLSNSFLYEPVSSWKNEREDLE